MELSKRSAARSLIGPAPLDLRGRVHLTHSGTLRIVGGGRSLSFEARRFPNPLFVAPVVLIILVGYAALFAFIAEWPSRIVFGLLLLFPYSFAVAGIFVPLLKERRNGPIIRIEPARAVVHLPRLQQELPLNQIRGLWFAWGSTRDVGTPRTRYLIAELSLITQDEHGELTRRPLVFGSGWDLRRLGRRIADHLGVPLESHHLPSEMMPTSTEFSKLSTRWTTGLPTPPATQEPRR